MGRVTGDTLQPADVTEIPSDERRGQDERERKREREREREKKLA